MDTTLMREAVRTSETSVYSNEIKRRYMPEGSHPQMLLCCLERERQSQSCLAYKRITKEYFRCRIGYSDRESP